jgi:hypothetical protein
VGSNFISGLGCTVKNLFGKVSCLARNWIKPALVLTLLVVLFIFWDSVRDGFAGWFVASDMGEWIGWEVEFVRQWLWVLGVTIVMVTTLTMLPKGLWSGIGKFANLLIFTVMLFALALVVATGKTPTRIYEDRVSGTSENLGCTTNKNSLDFMIDEGGRDVVVCKDEGQFFLIPTYRKSLVFEFSPKFARENEHLLKNRRLEDFVKIDPPMTFLGSTSESYRVTPVTTIKGQYVSDFDRSGLKQIVINVRAVE